MNDIDTSEAAFFKWAESIRPWTSKVRGGAAHLAWFEAVRRCEVEIKELRRMSDQDAVYIVKLRKEIETLKTKGPK